MNITFVARSAAFLHYLNFLALPTSGLEAFDAWWLEDEWCAHIMFVGGGFLESVKIWLCLCCARVQLLSNTQFILRANSMHLMCCPVAADGHNGMFEQPFW